MKVKAITALSIIVYEDSRTQITGDTFDLIRELLMSVFTYPRHSPPQDVTNTIHLLNLLIKHHPPDSVYFIFDIAYTSYVQHFEPDRI